VTTTEQLIAALEPITSRVRTDVTAIKVPEGGSRWVSEPLTKARLTKHIEGGLPRGCCPIKAGESVTSLAVLDLDSHKGAVTWAGMSEAARKITDACSMEGVTLVPFRSSGGKGLHLFALWDAPQDAYSVRQFFVAMLAAVGFRSGTKGVQDGEIEVFPKQNTVPLTGFGNQFILPLAGASVPLDHNMHPMQRDDIRAIDWPASDPVPLVAKPDPVVFTGALTQDFKQLQAHLAAIPNSGDKELDYDQWRNIVFAIHHETAGSDDGLALAHEFSSRASKYDPDLLDSRIWPYITSDRDSAITGKTIGFMAREHGYVEDVADDFDVVEEHLSDKPEHLSDKRNKFQPIHAAEFAIQTPTHWLVKGILPAGGTSPTMAVMYGASGSGKSFQATDMACAIARGIPWRDCRTTKGRVAYICAEGAGGYRKRLQAYALHHQINLTELDVWVIPAAPNLLEGDDVRALIHALLSIGPLALVIVDTLAQATAGGNENSGEDMGKAIGHCRTISEVLHCLVMLVHHSGKDDTKGARGHSSLKAAADTELEVVRGKDTRAMRVSKQKDGEDGQDMGFSLIVVPVGHDSDGDLITSCVIAHNSSTVADARQAGKKLGSVESVVMQVLLDGEDLASGGMDRESLLVASIAKLERGESIKDRRREVATRALKELLNNGRVKNEDGIVKPGVARE
jgi:hypothetical protein